MTRAPVNPEIIQWAAERPGVDPDALAHRFPKLEEWHAGEVQPTLKQLEAFAKATRTPFGFFFLPEPPVQQVPIPDFRTMGNELIDRPSPDLLDTIYACQQRQDWYRDYARSNHESPQSFVGSSRRSAGIVAAADRIRTTLGFSIEERRRCSTWTDALRRFVEQADNLGVLVMVSGVVGSNTHRKLDPAEFRGFALSDPHAPLVFINGADTKAGQMFTLAHELAHLWLGQTALSDVTPVTATSHAVETWCNKVAAELLVPLAVLQQEYDQNAPLHDEMSRLARRFKVSTLVVLRRLHDAGGLTRDQLWAEYHAELARLREMTGSSGGGNFYLTTPARVSKRFARAVVTDTLEGRTLCRDACRMLGFAKVSTFHELGHSLGVA